MSGSVELARGAVPLRVLLSPPLINLNCFESKSFLIRVYIVPPNVLSVNAWVRSVADRLAAPCHPFPALPLFWHCA